MNGRFLGSRMVHAVTGWTLQDGVLRGFGKSACGRYEGRVALVKEPLTCADCHWIRHGNIAPPTVGDAQRRSTEVP